MYCCVFCVLVKAVSVTSNDSLWPLLIQCSKLSHSATADMGLSGLEERDCVVAGLMQGGSARDKQYGHSLSQPSSLSRGQTPLSKGSSARGPSVRGSGPGDFQQRGTNKEDSYALEPEGFSVLAALMEGIQSDFGSLVISLSCSSRKCHDCQAFAESAKRNTQVLCCALDIVHADQIQLYATQLFPNMLELVCWKLIDICW